MYVDLMFDGHAADSSQCKEAEQGTGSHVRSEVDELHSDREGVRDVRYHRYVEPCKPYEHVSSLTILAGTMRSAILKPDVPPQSFPALKATEDDKQQSTKGPAKTAANKSKAGSKRKVSNPGVDEFGDAAIDDADLALAETGGFENIDDFDDDLGPSRGNAKKKQKQSHTNEDTSKEFEPRQLDNGKWACNHACKDKTSCKHYCCREGLDKKPKPPKAKASKKDNTVTDPKQTQLSMSVNKKADNPTASQSTQAQKPAPSSSRNPPTGPEFHNLNTLHNNVKSNTRQLPILDKTNATQQKPGSSIVLPGPNRPSHPFNEITREAEQNAFSDDFGDLDDFSLNDDPVLDQPSTRRSPLLRSRSDLPDIDAGNMFHSASPAQRDDSRESPAKTPQTQGPEWESLFDFDAEYDLLELGRQGATSLRQPNVPKKPQLDTGYAGPFEDMTSDSAAFDLDCKRRARRSSPVSNHERASDRLEPGPKAQAVPQESILISSEDSMQSEDKELLVALQENVACDVTPMADMPVEERPASSDSATRHFMEELGADLFNYVD